MDQVSDNAVHIKNRILRKAATALGINHHFSVANSAWTNGTLEKATRKVV